MRGVGLCETLAAVVTALVLGGMAANSPAGTKLSVKSMFFPLEQNRNILFGVGLLTQWYSSLSVWFTWQRFVKCSLSH